MKTLYLECKMGAAGDMLLGALLELMPDPEKTLAQLNGLGIPGVQKGFVQSPARNMATSAMQNLYRPGDRVRHLKFGEGTVVEVTGSGSTSRIKIEFTAYGTKEFALATAPIVKLED